MCDRGIRIIKVIFFACLGLSLFGFLYFCAIDHSEPLPDNDVVYIPHWEVTAPDGSTFTSGSSCRNRTYDPGMFTANGKMPAKIRNASYLCMIIGGDAAVFIDGELRKNFVTARDVVIPGGCVKRFYFLVPVQASDSGKDVTILRYGTARGNYIFQETFVASGSGLFSYMMGHYGLSLMLAEILLLFSAIVVICSLIMRFLYHQRIDMLYGALGILVIAGWIITNSYLFPFLYGHYHMDGVLNYMLCLLMPFCLIFYLNALQNGRYGKIMLALLCLSAVNLIVWPILHFTGTFSFPKALGFIDAVLAVAVVTVLVIMVIETIHKRVQEYKYTALGFVGFLICCLSEIVVLNFTPIQQQEIPMLIGLAVLLMMTIVQQIEDLKRLRDEREFAMNLSEAKTGFLAGMSREIRTPINGILSMNEMILRENHDPEIIEYAQNINSAGRMLLMLVNDVLDYSRIEAGRMEIKKERFLLSEMLLKTLPDLKERAEEKNLLFSAEVVSAVPNGLISDELRIRQILINLIGNAIKYTDIGSVKVLIGGQYARPDLYMLNLSIRDSGRGIKKEDQKHLFDAFTKADIGKSKVIEGTGISLAIAKNIVDSMGGTISVSSVYGEGSEFMILLPVEVSDKEVLRYDFMEQARSAAMDAKDQKA